MEATSLAMEWLRSAFIGLAVSFSLIGLAWPYLARDPFQIRFRKLNEDRQNRQDEFRREQNDNINRPSLTLLKRSLIFIARISDALKLTSDEEVIRLLRLAGFRGPTAMTNFQAFRVIFPIVVFVILLFYVKVIFRIDIPIPFLTFILGIPSCLGFYIPVLFVKNRAMKRKKAIIQAWPDTLDLLLIAVEAGMSTEAAFRKTANDMIRYSKEIAEELSITTAELSYLHDRKQAFANLADRTDSDEIRATTTALIQTERYGTSLGNSLRILAEESRNLRMREAERKAAALSPKLTVPMVIFFLPVLIVILIIPSLIRIWGWA